MTLTNNQKRLRELIDDQLPDMGEREVTIETIAIQAEQLFVESVGEDDRESQWSDDKQRFVVHRKEQVDARNDLRQSIRKEWGV